MEESIFRIPLPEDYEGSAEATLVRFAAECAPSRAVLYLHGYVDYFFQTHMARWFVARGWNFYALDLRKYGRSLTVGQTPYYCRDLHEYYPEIDRSIERMRRSPAGVRSSNRLNALPGRAPAAADPPRAAPLRPLSREVRRRAEFRAAWRRRRHSPLSSGEPVPAFFRAPCRRGQNRRV